MKSTIFKIQAISTATLLSVNLFAQKPNIIYILADDLGYGDLSCYGQTRFSTPNIDQLAKDGMRFTNHYSGSTVSAPTRACLMTGLHTGHSFIRGNSDNVLPANAQTFPKMLQHEGYVTGMFGKWGLGNYPSTGEPGLHGFDAFFGYTNQGLAHRYFPNLLVDNGVNVSLPGNDWTSKTVYSSDTIHSRALNFIDTHKDSPFFLYCAYTIPHAELIVPEDSIFLRFKNKYPETAFVGADYKGSTTNTGGYCSQANPKATFMAMIIRLDLYVGQIVKRLEKYGLSENTIIMFSSDNGPHQEGGADPVFFNSSGGLRGIKRDLYEGGIRTPFIVKWPNKINAGRVTDLQSAHWDVFPTLKEITNSQENYVGDGISMLPTWMESGTQSKHRYLYWEFYEKNGRRALRWGDWKLVQYAMETTPNAAWLLYNFKTDPQETTNVAATYPEIVNKLKNAIEIEHISSDKIAWPFESNSSFTNVNVTVNDMNGSPINDATVILDNADSRITWEEGLAIFRGVSSHNATITVKLNGNIVGSKSVQVSGKQVNVPITIINTDLQVPKAEIDISCFVDRTLNALRVKSNKSMLSYRIFNTMGVEISNGEIFGTYVNIPIYTMNSGLNFVEITSIDKSKKTIKAFF